MIEVIPTLIMAALAALAVVALIAGAAAALNALRARRLRAQRTELMEELGMLQSALLPNVPAHIGPLWVSAAYRPADGPTAGGHFYDAFELSGGRAGALVGEVSASARDRLGEATLARHALRTHLKAGHSPAEAIRLTGQSLHADLSGELRNVTVALHEPAAQRLRHACLGEAAPLILLPDGRVEDGANTTSREATDVTTPLPTGARVLLFTGGLQEARRDGRRLDREDVVEVFRELGEEASAERLLDAIAAASRSLPSDLAACVLEADDDPALVTAQAHGEPVVGGGR